MKVRRLGKGSCTECDKEGGDSNPPGIVWSIEIGPWFSYIVLCERHLLRLSLAIDDVIDSERVRGMGEEEK